MWGGVSCACLESLANTALRCFRLLFLGGEPRPAEVGISDWTAWNRVQLKSRERTPTEAPPRAPCIPIQQ